MPVRIIGMVSVTPPSSDASLHVIEGGLSPVYLAEFARAHDAAGFIWRLWAIHHQRRGSWSPCTPRCRQNRLAIS
jgi:hypothetical protein